MVAQPRLCNSLRASRKPWMSAWRLQHIVAFTGKLTRWSASNATNSTAAGTVGINLG
eukprot:CAMPEP_0115351176 /NCGR_PEP_ID=MMETSP0270-20121206/96857_1 /TAXON_ID=71861 /ORGANISM="Scrippsiella trochoidea, Strain CCMP3099" /LENGTH=56 /DNA_ID=CAMNT_0002773313 /DNA_START=97 /DNA_END=267 /DNA_ORIENTATION=-